MTLQITKPVPFWSDLADYVHRDLTSKGLGEQPFDDLSDEFRLSVLNLYVKLRGVTIGGDPGWDHLQKIRRVDIGVIDFIPQALGALKAALKAERTFANPYGESWQSRELRLKDSLHFKHSTDWGEMVSVHIDPVGLYTGPGAIRKIEAPFIGPVHLVCYYDFQNVEEIRGKLLSQGWDPGPLLGLSVTQ
jgi:hypothetical protein